MKTSLTCKLVRTKVKSGWTTHDFLTTYGINEVEFKDFIQKKFLKSSDSIFRSLKSNDKFAKRTVATESVQDDSSEKSTEALPDYSIEEKSEAMEIVNTEPESISEECEGSSDLSDITELTERENSLSSEICKQEAFREELLSDKRSIFNTLHNQRLEILRLKELVEQEMKNINGNILHLNSLSEQIEEVNLHISDLNCQLQDVRLQIKQQQKVFIYCYSNGEIEVENYLDELPDFDDKFGLVLQQVSYAKDFENLSLKEIKSYSKILALVELFDTQGRSFDITFDNPTLQNIWEVNLGK